VCRHRKWVPAAWIAISMAKSTQILAAPRTCRAAPSGTLNSFWAQPVAGFEYRVAKGWTGKAYWGYHNYHEDETVQSPQDIFVPRNFHANLVTLSLRYAF
jgi:hypothetical protein